jgi:hypothetical protein
VKILIYPIEIHENKPYIGIGGGSKTKTFSFRTVLRKNQSGQGYLLKKATFIRTTGNLSNAYDQGITELQTGDIIVFVAGNIPIIPDNKLILLNGFQVSEINLKEGYAMTEDVQLKFSDLPEKVWIGAKEYHNRDGSLFSGDEDV